MATSIFAVLAVVMLPQGQAPKVTVDLKDASPKEAITMIKEIRSYPLLLGVRGERKKDIDSLVQAILKVGEVLQQCRGISDIEINPLVVDDKGIKAVDTRILLSS